MRGQLDRPSDTLGQVETVFYGRQEVEWWSVILFPSGFPLLSLSALYFNL